MASYTKVAKNTAVAKVLTRQAGSCIAAKRCLSRTAAMQRMQTAFSRGVVGGWLKSCLRKATANPSVSDFSCLAMSCHVLPSCMRMGPPCTSSGGSVQRQPVFLSVSGQALVASFVLSYLSGRVGWRRLAGEASFGPTSITFLSIQSLASRRGPCTRPSQSALSHHRAC